MASHTNGFQLAPEEYFVDCPYDKSHTTVTNTRQMRHLEKCRQQYKKQMAAKGQKPEIVSCRYNDIHRYPKIEMDVHENGCPDKGNAIKTIQFHNEKLPEKLAAVPEQTKSLKSKNTPMGEGENWEAEVKNGYTAGYDPKQKLESNYFLYQRPGLSKSERQQDRFENRQRYQKRQDVIMDKAESIPGLNYFLQNHFQM